MSISIKNAQKYEWGNGCFGWHLVNTPELSVIQESMPPGTEERLHYHTQANQFFFILQGEATFIIEEETHVVGEKEGIFIASGQQHKIINQSSEEIHFTVTSQPHAHGDRYNVD